MQIIEDKLEQMKYIKGYYVVGWDSPNRRVWMMNRLRQLGYTAMTPISEPIGDLKAIHAYGLTLS